MDPLMGFFFDGVLPASKSILNRLLVVSSFAPHLQIIGESQCDDVVAMKRALMALKNPGQPIDCRAAGTTFRFLSLLVSRRPGRHRLKGSPRLLQRPQLELIRILEQLGAKASLSATELVIESEGWREPRRALRIDRSQSSQFASAVLLSAWDLPFDLEIEFTGASTTEAALSEGYLEMTRSVVSELGLSLAETPHGLRIHTQSRVQAKCIRAESDMSSAFAVAALAAVGGEARIREFPQASLQPDSVFPEILRKMGVPLERFATELRVSRAGKLDAIDWNLRDCPDLFPVLSVLCAFASGRSHLFGAPHLALKESSRIESSARLLRLLGCGFEIRPDGMIIEGRSLAGSAPLDVAGVFAPEDDHRLAMAAAVAKNAGFNIEISHPEVVNKSFPEFWDIFRAQRGSER